MGFPRWRSNVGGASRPTPSTPETSSVYMSSSRSINSISISSSSSNTNRTRTPNPYGPPYVPPHQRRGPGQPGDCTSNVARTLSNVLDHSTPAPSRNNFLGALDNMERRLLVLTAASRNLGAEVPESSLSSPPTAVESRLVPVDAAATSSAFRWFGGSFPTLSQQQRQGGASVTEIEENNSSSLQAAISAPPTLLPQDEQQQQQRRPRRANYGARPHRCAEEATSEDDSKTNTNTSFPSSSDEDHSRYSRFSGRRSTRIGPTIASNNGSDDNDSKILKCRQKDLVEQRKNFRRMRALQQGHAGRVSRRTTRRLQPRRHRRADIYFDAKITKSSLAVMTESDPTPTMHGSIPTSVDDSYPHPASPISFEEYLARLETLDLSSPEDLQRFQKLQALVGDTSQRTTISSASSPSPTPLTPAQRKVLNDLLYRPELEANSIMPHNEPWTTFMMTSGSSDGYPSPPPPHQSLSADCARATSAKAKGKRKKDGNDCGDKDRGMDVDRIAALNAKEGYVPWLFPADELISVATPTITTTATTLAASTTTTSAQAPAKKKLSPEEARERERQLQARIDALQNEIHLREDAMAMGLPCSSRDDGADDGEEEKYVVGGGIGSRYEDYAENWYEMEDYGESDDNEEIEEVVVKSKSKAKDKKEKKEVVAPVAELERRIVTPHRCRGVPLSKQSLASLRAMLTRTHQQELGLSETLTQQQAESQAQPQPQPQLTQTQGSARLISLTLVGGQWVSTATGQPVSPATSTSGSEWPSSTGHYGPCPMSTLALAPMPATTAPTSTPAYGGYQQSNYAPAPSTPSNGGRSSQGVKPSFRSAVDPNTGKQSFFVPGGASDPNRLPYPSSAAGPDPLLFSNSSFSASPSVVASYHGFFQLYSSTTTGICWLCNYPFAALAFQHRQCSSGHSPSIYSLLHSDIIINVDDPSLFRRTILLLWQQLAIPFLPASSAVNFQSTPAPTPQTAAVITPSSAMKISGADAPRSHLTTSSTTTTTTTTTHRSARYLGSRTQPGADMHRGFQGSKARVAVATLAAESAAGGSARRRGNLRGATTVGWKDDSSSSSEDEEGAGSPRPSAPLPVTSSVPAPALVSAPILNPAPAVSATFISRVLTTSPRPLPPAALPFLPSPTGDDAEMDCIEANSAAGSISVSGCSGAGGAAGSQTGLGGNVGDESNSVSSGVDDGSGTAGAGGDGSSGGAGASSGENSDGNTDDSPPGGNGGNGGSSGDSGNQAGLGLDELAALLDITNIFTDQSGDINPEPVSPTQATGFAAGTGFAVAAVAPSGFLVAAAAVGVSTTAAESSLVAGVAASGVTIAPLGVSATSPVFSTASAGESYGAGDGSGGDGGHFPGTKSGADSDSDNNDSQDPSQQPLSQEADSPTQAASESDDELLGNAMANMNYSSDSEEEGTPDAEELARRAVVEAELLLFLQTGAGATTGPIATSSGAMSSRSLASPVFSAESMVAHNYGSPNEGPGTGSEADSEGDSGDDFQLQPQSPPYNVQMPPTSGFSTAPGATNAAAGPSTVLAASVTTCTTTTAATSSTSGSALDRQKRKRQGEDIEMGSDDEADEDDVHYSKRLLVTSSSSTSPAAGTGSGSSATGTYVRSVTPALSAVTGTTQGAQDSQRSHDLSHDLSLDFPLIRHGSGYSGWRTAYRINRSNSRHDLRIYHAIGRHDSIHSDYLATSSNDGCISRSDLRLYLPIICYSSSKSSWCSTCSRDHSNTSRDFSLVHVNFYYINRLYNSSLDEYLSCKLLHLA
ncbi:hypothetical protein BGW39_004753 [Mortierella sp. 14UC]|nr:hypothetical protein BGW39_004753 [Mortierella sp. 14UC]